MINKKGIVYNGIRDRFFKAKKNNDKGFTLVELIVVLMLIAILASITIFGGLAWQDWVRFNHEEATAQDIFFAAQNQLIELDSSGAIDNKVKDILKSGTNYDPKYILASPFDYEALEDIAYKSGSSSDSKICYKWETVWSSYLKNNSLGRQSAYIITLSAKSGDYDIYTAIKNGDSTKGTISDGTELLFDIVTPYISDRSVLNGAIILEFSPEAGQVFSVCYSDRVGSFDYSNSSSGSTVGVNDRRLQVRKENMFGYYSVDQLYEKLNGKEIIDSDLRFEIKSDNVLEMIVHDNTGVTLEEGDNLQFKLYKGDTGITNTPAMTFNIGYKKHKGSDDKEYVQPQATSYGDGLAAAMSDPTLVSIQFGDGVFTNETYDFRLPVWIDQRGDMHIVLDAADIQAESYAYYKAFIREGGEDSGKEADLEAFRNTYSFYRFGLSTSDSSDTHYIYGNMIHTNQAGQSDEGTDSSRFVAVSAEAPDGYIPHTSPDLVDVKGRVGECTTFGSYDMSEENTRHIELKNARHLFNVRYETDYKKNKDINNEFKLKSDIDWFTFVGKKPYDKNGNTANFFLNSFDETVNSDVVAGINYPGNNMATGGHGVPDSVETDTANCPFPGFRCLSKGDSFIQDNPADIDQDDHTVNDSDESYTISNLTISVSANIVYGVYDTVFYDKTLPEAKKDEYAQAKSHCLDGDFSRITEFSETAPFPKNASDFNGYQSSMPENSGSSSIARSGRIPLGLFAENLGTIENITLDKHIVRGMEVLGTNKNIIYTCMVGGFAGNNYGTVKNLTLLDSAKNNTENKTHINGRTDVGGIVGRVSFTTNETDKTVKLDQMYNEASVTGYEYVGGIVGRAYVHYINDNDNADMVGSFTSDAQKARYKYYHDGYKITDETEPKSASGERVYRAKSVSIENSFNKGQISGDKLIYDADNHYLLDTVNTFSADYSIHAAFIGGIAGATLDGYISDGNSSVDAYVNNNFYKGAFNYVGLTNCDSVVMYTKDEITEFADDFKARTAQNRDCYVGGLVGYAKFTVFTDCSSEDKEYFGSSEKEYPLVIGQNYVGGLVGCLDESRFASSGSTTSGGYSAVNYSLVIGKRYVGGIAGGAGIGDSSKDNGVDFRNPAGNEASAPIASNGNVNREVLKNVLNKGIVLGQKSDKLFEKRNANTEGGITEYPERQGAAAIGGVVGSLCVQAQDIDNKQTEATKKFAMKLVGFSDEQINDFDNLATDVVIGVVDSSKFGGNRVGGLVGSVNSICSINRVSETTSEQFSSEIDAVVFGQDIVGGGIGFSFYDNSNAYNIYPVGATTYTGSIDGMLVIGRDSVGGLVGAFCDFNNIKLNSDDKVNNKSNVLDDAIVTPYSVYGRAGVGGVIGSLGFTQSLDGRTNNVKISMSDGNKISVNGIAFVGGFGGVSENKPFTLKGTVSGVSVNAKYFAGGYYGAITSGESLDELSSRNLIVQEIDVKADAFAGGVSGVAYNSSGYEYFLKVDIEQGTEVCNKAEGTLNKLFEGRLTNDSGYPDANSAFNKVVNTDVNNANDFAANKTSLYTCDLMKDDEPFTSEATVEAKLFAGGLFGYIPEGTKMSIKHFVNNGNIKATGYVGGDSTTKVNESANSDDKFAYLGAVVGRVPKGTVVDGCVNLKNGDSYSAQNATYLGGLAEVNAGVIQNCNNDTEYSYESGGVGAFAGMNGTDMTYISYADSLDVNPGLSTGLIYNCQNNKAITSTNGFAGGMAAADGKTTDTSESRRTSAIVNCVNLGTITGGEAAGMVSQASGSDIIVHCRNYGTISGTNGNYAMADLPVGNITKNLEASGLSHEKNVNDPLAPMKSQNLTRNFYIAGSVEESDVEDGIDLNNVGDIYFDIETQSGNTAMSSLIGGYYNQTDEIKGVSNKSRWMGDTSRSDFYVKYNVKGDFEESGLKMNYFTFVWSNGEWVSNHKYVYYVTYEYKDKAGVPHTTEPARREITQDAVTVIDAVPAPHGKDVLGVTSITIQATYEDNVVKLGQNSVQFLYYCAYWTDSSYKHFIWDAANTETISAGDTVYFKSRAKRNDAYSDAESGTDDNHPPVYNLQPELTTPVSTQDLNSRFKKISLGSGYNKIYDNTISVQSPTTGLEGDFFRIYWLYLFWQEMQYKYTVAFTYLDNMYEEQTVYYDRVINKMADPDYNTPGARETEYHMLDQLFYDEIPMRDVDGNKIKPIKIQLYIDCNDVQADYYYSAMTWGYYSKNTSGETVRTERIISDYDNRYSTSDLVNGYVDTTAVDAAKYVPAKHDTAAEDIRFTYRGDYWSKQLTVLHDTSGKYNLVYKRYGFYQLDKRLLATPMDSDFNGFTPEAKYDAIDEWFMNTFINDTTNYPNTDFAGETE
ncbi:MAG: type II secretion system protein [Eubacterium sp.]|nr:type II secretion system protein [Eubacterium sp.]